MTRRALWPHAHGNENGRVYRPPGRHHIGGNGFTPCVVRDSDDGAFAHQRMGVKGQLDVAGEDVEAAGDDHVLASINDAQEPVPVAGGYIARAQPTVSERFHGCRRVVQVAVHDERSTHADLSRRVVWNGDSTLVKQPDIDR